jgi:hypothetical protein
MRRRRHGRIFGLTIVAVVASTCVSVGALAASPRTSGAPNGTWQTSLTVPGIVSLNHGGYTELDAESCTSPGYCSAGGEYRPVAHSTRMSAFVVSELHGVWGNAIQAPGIATLNGGGFAQLHALDCASAGNCAAGGGFRKRSGDYVAYVIVEVRGVWRPAIEVPGMQTLNRGRTSSVSTLSCPSAGNCTAGGYYTDAVGHVQAFVVDEVRGTWRTAIEAPGTAELNVDGDAAVDAITCTIAGSCTAGGGYKDGAAAYQAFVVSEVHGVWGVALEAPGTSTLNVGSRAAVSALSCVSTGNCAVGGDYRDSSFHQQVFMVNEVNGVWGSAVELPGANVLNKGGSSFLYTVSCAGFGSCVAGGSYTDARDRIQSFLVGEAHGAWGSTFEVSGSQALNTYGGGEGISSISCSAVGTCAAAGDYADNKAGGSPVYVVNESHGIWGRATEVPGSAALNTGDSATVFAVSCTPSGWCGAGGNYLQRSGQFEDFVTTFSPTPVVTLLTPDAGSARGGTVVVVHGLHLFGATTVMVGLHPATRVHVLGDGTLNVTVPPGTGTVDVRVRTPGGTSAIVVPDRFRYQG